MGYGAKQRQQDNKEAVSLAKLAGAGLLSTGRIYYVKHTADVDRSEFILDVPKLRRKTTIQGALDATRDGSNDYVLLCPQDDSGAWVQTADIDVNGTGKQGRDVHLIGLAQGLNRPEISFAVAKALRIGNGALTGDRCRGIELANLKITSSGTANLHCVEIGDSSGFTFDTWIHDCEIANAATTAAIAEIKDFGNGLLLERCIIGQTAAHPDDNILQGAGAGRLLVRDCIFLHKAGAVGDQFITLITGGDPSQFMDCLFHNHNAGTTDMTHGIVAADTNQAVIMNCMFTGADAAATTAKSLVAPSGMGLTVLASDVFNPGLAIDGAEPVAADT